MPSSILNVDFIANATGNSSPTTNPPAQGDSSTHIATTGWAQSEIASAVQATFQPAVAVRDWNIGNLYRATIPGFSGSVLTKGQRVRVRFDHATSAADTPLPFGTHGVFFAPLMIPDAVLNTDTWLTDANLVATSTLTRGARQNCPARVYQANGTPSNSRVYSKYASAVFNANTTYRVSLTLQFGANSGTFPTSGFALRIPYRDSSNNQQYATVPITDVASNSTPTEVSVTFTTGYASTGPYELLYGLNTACSFAISDFRVIKVNNSPRLVVAGTNQDPILVQIDEETGQKFNFLPAAGSAAELEYDGVDWVAVNGQGIRGNHFRYINGTSFDQCRLTYYDLGGTAVYNGGQSASVYLPKLVDLAVGGKITLYNSSNYGVTVYNGQGSTSSGDTLLQNGGSQTYALTIGPKSSATFTLYGVGQPILVDGDINIQTRSSNSWGVYFGGNGYQKLPSGIILQWGIFYHNTGVNGNVSTPSFPIAFPNGALTLIVGTGTDDQGGAEVYNFFGLVSSGFSGRATLSATYTYLAIGY